MVRAFHKKMTYGDYVFITPNLLPSPNLDRLWENGDSDDEIARLAFQRLIQMALGFVTSPEADQFRQEVPYALALPPWNFNESLSLGIMVNLILYLVFSS